MPISDYRHIPQVLDEVYALQPETVLELGIGFGKWGVLLREVLDAMYGRCCKHQWKRKIAGVDAWGWYRNPSWDVYDEVFIGDFSDYDKKDNPFEKFDLVMMMDSLEHLTPEVGRPFLRSLVEKNKHVIISVPNGYMPQDGSPYGNEYENHRWTFNGLEEFQFPGTKLLYQGLCTVVSIPGLRIAQ